MDGTKRHFFLTSCMNESERDTKYRQRINSKGGKLLCHDMPMASSFIRRKHIGLPQISSSSLKVALEDFVEVSALIASIVLCGKLERCCRYLLQYKREKKFCLVQSSLISEKRVIFHAKE